MQCPRCRAEQPVWARYCMQCGETLLSVPRMEGPPASPAPTPSDAAAVPPSPAPPQDFRAQLAIGAVLAFVATLVVPPLTGGIAMVLGYRVYVRGAGHQRKQGLWLMIGAAAAIVLGMAIALYAQEAGLLPT